MNLPLILLGLGGVAVYLWSKASPAKPTEKTEALEGASPLPPDVTTALKAGASKVVDIVKKALIPAAAAVPLTALPAATAIPAGVSAAAPTALASTAFIPAAAVVPLTALPAATILPAGLSAMAPTTLASAAFVPGTAAVTPAVVGTGSGVSSVGAGGSAGAGAVLAGAAVFAAPLVIVPLLAKALDSIFGGRSPQVVATPEQLAQRKAETDFIKAETEAGKTVAWNPKTGWVDDPDYRGSDF